MEVGVCNGDILWILPPKGHVLVKEASKKPRKAMDTATSVASAVEQQVDTFEIPFQSCSMFQMPTMEVAVSKPEKTGRWRSASTAVARLLHVACVESGLEPVLRVSSLLP